MHLRPEMTSDVCFISCTQMSGSELPPTFGTLLFTDVDRGRECYGEDNYESDFVRSFVPAPLSGAFGGGVCDRSVFREVAHARVHAAAHAHISPHFSTSCIIQATHATHDSLLQRFQPIALKSSRTRDPRHTQFIVLF